MYIKKHMVLFNINKKGFFVATFALVTFSLLITTILFGLINNTSASVEEKVEVVVPEMPNYFPSLFVKTFLLEEVELTEAELFKLGLNPEEKYLVKDLMRLDSDLSEDILKSKREEFLSFYENYGISETQEISIHDFYRSEFDRTYSNDKLLRFKFGQDNLIDSKLFLSRNNAIFNILNSNGDFNSVVFFEIVETRGPLSNVGGFS